MKQIDTCRVTTAVTAAGNLMAKGLSAEEISLLSAVFMQLADVLGVIAAAQSLSAASEPEKTEKSSE